MTGETINWSAVTRRTTFGLAAGVLGAASAPGAAQSPRRRDWSPLDVMAARAVARRLTPGIQLSVMERGTLIYSKAFGSANLETGTR